MMNSMDAKSTVKKLTEILSRFGLPDMIVSDNAPTFTSSEFQQFLARNRIGHRMIAPYCPQSNGLAERAVRELKVRLDKLSDLSDLSMQEVIDKWLFLHRVTPHATTGESPAQLLLGYKPITRFDKLKPDIEGKVKQNQERQVQHHKQKCPTKWRLLELGQTVWAKQYGRNVPLWISAVVTKCLHPLYWVCMANGQTQKRHMNQLFAQDLTALEPEETCEDRRTADVVLAPPQQPPVPVAAADQPPPEDSWCPPPPIAAAHSSAAVTTRRSVTAAPESAEMDAPVARPDPGAPPLAERPLPSAAAERLPAGDAIVGDGLECSPRRTPVNPVQSRRYPLRYRQQTQLYQA